MPGRANGLLERLSWDVDLKEDLAEGAETSYCAGCVEMRSVCCEIGEEMELQTLEATQAAVGVHLPLPQRPETAREG